VSERKGIYSGNVGKWGISSKEVNGNQAIDMRNQMINYRC